MRDIELFLKLLAAKVDHTPMLQALSHPEDRITVYTWLQQCAKKAGKSSTIEDFFSQI